MNEKVDKELEPSKKVKKGVGGWLLLFVILLTIINPLLNFPEVLALLSSIYQIFSFHLLILLFILPIIIPIIIEITSFIGLICFSIYAGVSLWRVKPNAVKIAKIFLITQIIIYIINFIINLIIVISYVPIYPVTIEFSDMGPIISKVCISSIVSVAWFCYLTKSKRVKATYGKKVEGVESIEDKE